MENDLLIKPPKIPPNGKVAFQELILSNKKFEDKKIIQAWISEAKDRIDAITSDKAKLLDFEDLYNDN